MVLNHFFLSQEYYMGRFSGWPASGNYEYSCGSSHSHKLGNQEHGRLGSRAGRICGLCLGPNRKTPWGSVALNRYSGLSTEENCSFRWLPLGMRKTEFSTSLHPLQHQIMIMIAEWEVAYRLIDKLACKPNVCHLCLPKSSTFRVTVFLTLQIARLAFPSHIL